MICTTTESYKGAAAELVNIQLGERQRCMQTPGAVPQPPVGVAEKMQERAHASYTELSRNRGACTCMAAASAVLHCDNGCPCR